MNARFAAINRFGRDSRLLTPGDYAGAFAGRRQLRGVLFVLHYRHNDGAAARLGLAIPKKQARNAVLRNAIKRQAREAFRYRRAVLPALDLILRLAQPIRKGLDGNGDKMVWRREIETLFERLCSDQRP